MTADQVGEVLYVQFSDMPEAKSFNLGVADFTYTVFLPEDKFVEIKRQYYYNSYYNYPVEIDSDAVSNHFIVDVSGSVRLRVNSQADLAVTAVVSGPNSLRGNVDWSIETQPDTNETVGNVFFGSGLHQVNIVNQGDVEVIFFDYAQEESFF